MNDCLSATANERCSVVIPTKNGGGLFERVLENLQRQNIWGSVELLVVDSGSTDGTVEAARRAGAKVIQIPPGEFNHGATRDYGISQARSEIVVLMVQDAVPNDSNLLETILRRFSDPGDSWRSSMPVGWPKPNFSHQARKRVSFKRNASVAAPTHLQLTRQELAAFVLGTRAPSETDPLSQLDRVLDRSHLMPPGAVESVIQGMKAGNDP